MNNNFSSKIPIDNSGIVHLAVFPDGKPNLFRINLRMKEEVDPALLQQAVDALSPRFPGIIAGIRQGFFRHYAVSPKRPPRVRPDKEAFALMGRKELGLCAARILYGEKSITLECFHSLTDGSGGLAFVNALAAEYLRLLCGEDYSNEPGIISPFDPIDPLELEDSYLRHAGKEKLPRESRPSYRLPGENPADGRVHHSLAYYDADRVLSAAREHGVTVAGFITAAAASAVMDIQHRHHSGRKPMRPVHMMVPADMRRLFPSKSLRNFSLYTFARMEPHEHALPFERLVKNIASQIKEGLAPERLQAMMASNAVLERNPFMKYCPLFLKLFLIRMGYRVCGARTSCFTVTNLGRPRFPSRTLSHLEGVDILLTPRLCSPYNMGLLTFGEKLVLCISRNCKEPEFELSLFEKLRSLGLEGSFVMDGEPANI